MPTSHGDQPERRGPQALPLPPPGPGLRPAPSDRRRAVRAVVLGLQLIGDEVELNVASARVDGYWS